MLRSSLGRNLRAPLFRKEAWSFSSFQTLKSNLVAIVAERLDVEDDHGDNEGHETDL